MLSALRARQPGHSLWQIAWWYLLHFFCFVFCTVLYRYRAWGTHYIPRAGPVLFVANHESFLDPILVGMGGHCRQFHSMARKTLWKHRVLGWLLNTLNTIPIDQNASDMTAIRRCIEAMKRGHALLVFPEGSRTIDGNFTPFAPGVLLLIKRARPAIVPVAVRGTFEVWPRAKRLPRCFGRIGVIYGKAISTEQLLADGSEQALKCLHSEVETMRDQLGQRLGCAVNLDR